MISRKKQHGIFSIMLAISLFAIVGVIGLAIDSLDLFLNKERLQSALDIAALGAAATLNASKSTNTDADSITLATTDGKEALGIFLHKTDNAFVKDINLDNVTFEYSEDLNPFTPSGTNPRFVRVRLDQQAVLALPTYFIRIFGYDQKFVSASAVSGPIPLGNSTNLCNLAPLMICSLDDSDDSYSDTDHTYYGYNLSSAPLPQNQKEYCIKVGAGSNACETVGNGANQVNTYLNGSPNVLSEANGNYGPIRLPSKDGSTNGSDVFENNLLFGSDCDDVEDVVTEPGNMTGATSDGINPRFGDYDPDQNRIKAILDATVKDYVTTSFSLIEGTGAGEVEMVGNTMIFHLANNDSQPAYISKFAHYQNEYSSLSGVDSSSPKYQSRLLAIPVMTSCPTPISGNTSLHKIGVMCSFVTQTVPKGGGDSVIAFELIAPDICNVEGNPAPGNNNNFSGPFKIVLYDDPDRDDS